MDVDRKDNHMPKNSFGSFPLFLRERRLAAGLSQGDVAKKLGYGSPQFVSNWERGLSLPLIESLREVAVMYNVPEEEMLRKMIDITVEKLRGEMKEKFRSNVK